MARTNNPKKSTKEIHQNQNPQKSDKPHSWLAVRGFFTCKYLQLPQPQPQQKPKQEPPPPPQQQQKDKKERKHQQQQHQQEQLEESSSKKCKKLKCSGSLCSNTRVMHRPETSSPEALQRKKAAAASSASSSTTNNNDSSNRSMKPPLNEHNGVVSSTNSSLSSSSSSISIAGSSFRGMPFRRFSGCYECRMVVDPVLGFTRDPSLRSSICTCPDCGEIFMKTENLELHQAVRHAVSELGPEDTSKNIVEIIFQSSWLKKQAPICKIDRILKVHNTQRTISKFEEYRDSIKAKANKLQKKHPRCIADGNELLRFHCTTFACSLGLNGSSNLCNSIPHCHVCSIIKNGFKEHGILTTAASGRAHDRAEILEQGNNGDKRAMLVCRVIAGRVKKSVEGCNNTSGTNMEDYDSVGGAVGVYSNLDELYVFNPKAILPCFVVIYTGF